MRISDWSSDVCSSDLRHFLKILGPLRRGHDDVAEADLGLAGCILDRSVLREHGRTQACDRDGAQTRRTICLHFHSPKSPRSELSVCDHVRLYCVSVILNILYAANKSHTLRFFLQSHYVS